MTQAWFDPQYFALLTLGVGGFSFALVGLFSYHRRQSFPLWAHWLLGSQALLGGLFSGAALLGQQSFGLWLPPLLLLVVYLLFFALPTTAGLQVLHALSHFLDKPRVRFLSLLVLLILCPLVSALVAFQAIESTAPGDDLDLSGLFEPGPDKTYELVDPSPVATDQARPVRIRKKTAAAPSELDPAVFAKQSNVLENMALKGHVIQITTGWQNCNCHGWVFTGGQYWLENDDVEAILQDNGYQPTAEPAANDLVVYYDLNGKVSHTGLVRTVGSGMILVESKWGKLGRFLHPHNVHCYDNHSCTFYRSPRFGHLLQGLSRPAPNLPAPELLSPYSSPSPKESGKTLVRS